MTETPTIYQILVLDLSSNKNYPTLLMPSNKGFELVKVSKYILKTKLFTLRVCVGILVNVE